MGDTIEPKPMDPSSLKLKEDQPDNVAKITASGNGMVNKLIDNPNLTTAQQTALESMNNIIYHQAGLKVPEPETVELSITQISILAKEVVKFNPNWNINDRNVRQFVEVHYRTIADKEIAIILDEARDHLTDVPKEIIALQHQLSIGVDSILFSRKTADIVTSLRKGGWNDRQIDRALQTKALVDFARSSPLEALETTDELARIKNVAPTAVIAEYLPIIANARNLQPDSNLNTTSHGFIDPLTRINDFDNAMHQRGFIWSISLPEAPQGVYVIQTPSAPNQPSPAA